MLVRPKEGARAGEIVDMAPHLALDLIAAGRAERVRDEDPGSASAAVETATTPARETAQGASAGHQAGGRWRRGKRGN